MRRRVVAAVAGVVLGLGAMTACTGSDESGDPGAGGTDAGAPVATMSADGLPQDYPRDEAPIVSGGEVASVKSHGDGGYDFTVIVDGSPTTIVPKAVQLLEDAGWTLQTGSGKASEPAQVLRDGDGLVILTNDASEDRTVLSYTVDLP